MKKNTRVKNNKEKKRDKERKVILTIQASLDGLIAEPHNGMNFLQAGVGESIQDSIENVWRHVDTILMGRVMYEGLSQFWPFQTGEFADFMNKLPKYVYSKSLTEVTWGKFDNIEIVKGNISEHIKNLKEADSNKSIILVGGAKVVQSFLNLGLIDEIAIGIHPAILTEGEPLWRNLSLKTSLNLKKSKYYPKSGMVLNTYQVIHI